MFIPDQQYTAFFLQDLNRMIIGSADPFPQFFPGPAIIAMECRRFVQDRQEVSIRGDCYAKGFIRKLYSAGHLKSR